MAPDQHPGALYRYRTFYEERCVEAVWSVREPGRLIASLCYGESGLADRVGELLT